MDQIDEANYDQTTCNRNTPATGNVIMADIRSVVVLTGAGVSAESGLKTFRDNNGLWENERIEDVATPQAFQRDSRRVQHFYNLRRRKLLDPALKPNPAHLSLADFQENFQGNFSVITQNVDNLHERAGSAGVIHMHGELLKARCIKTGQVFPRTGDILGDSRCVCCGQAGALRPDIVWFGEIPKYMDLIERRLAECDLFISIGTSGTVYPAAGFKQMAAARGAETVELNMQPSPGYSGFDEARYGPASAIVPAYLAELQGRIGGASPGG